MKNRATNIGRYIFYFALTLVVLCMAGYAIIYLWKGISALADIIGFLYMPDLQLWQAMLIISVSALLIKLATDFNRPKLNPEILQEKDYYEKKLSEKVRQFLQEVKDKKIHEDKEKVEALFNQYNKEWKMYAHNCNITLKVCKVNAEGFEISLYKTIQKYQQK
jgi:membrane protein implicated in regulation of membrane protease activity